MEQEQLLNKAARYCARRECCQAEVQQKLLQWGATPEQIQPIIAYLKQHDFINHSRYAQAFAHDKLHFNHWGKQKIKYALLQKQIEPHIIEQALEQLDQQVYSQILLKVLKNKLATMPPNEPNLRAKLINYAAGKGFEYELIEQTLEKLLKPEE